MVLEELSEEYLSGDHPIITSRSGENHEDDDDDSTVTLNWDIQESDAQRKEETKEASIEENEDVAEAVCDAVVALQRVVDVLVSSRAGKFICTVLTIFVL
mgnify:CR=1 FL=1